MLQLSKDTDIRLFQFLLDCQQLFGNIITQSTMSKSSQQQVLQSIITSSIKSLQQHYAQTNKDELDQFKQRLKLLDKGLKQLDANPYFFLFMYMVSTKSQLLIQDALKNIDILLSEHFLSPYKSLELWQNLVSLLRKSIPLKPLQSASIISKLQQPNTETFELIFDVLEHTQNQKVETSCINLLGKIFEFKYIHTEDFQKKVATLLQPSKRIEYEFQLLTPQQLNQLLTYYVKKVVVEMVDRVEILQGEAVKGTGKFGLCFMCRELADHYCKDTKVPVCGSNCKKAHLQQLQKVSRGTVHFPMRDKQTIEQFLFNRLYITQNQNIRTLIFWCFIKIMVLSQYKINRKLKINEYLTDTLDFKKNYLHFCFLYASERHQLCEHSFHNILLYGQNQQYSMLLQNYFSKLFEDKRLFRVFYNFDMQPNRISIIKQILQYFSRVNKKTSTLFIEQLLDIVLSNHPTNTLQPPMVNEIDLNNTLIAIFNGSDKKLFESETSKRSNEQNACFIYKNQRFLNKEKVATYLTKQQNREILREYLSLLDIKDIELQFAIRQVFFHISPRQSQQIYRVIQEFCKIHKSARLSTEDELFQFSYFIIMLQTELHNPIVEKRTTYDQMIKRVSDFNKTLSQNTEYMSQIYRNIQNRPFSQSSKILNLSHIQNILQKETVEYHPCLIVYENWQTIYVIVSTESSYKSLELAYKTAVLLTKFKISQHFLHLLIRELYQRPFAENHTIVVFKWVFDLIFREPNYVQKEWPKIFYLFYRYQSLREGIQSGVRPDLENELRAAEAIIPDEVICKTFQTSEVLSDDQLVQMCQGICTIPIKYYIHLIPYLIQINLKRLNVFWKNLSIFIGSEPNYIFKTTCFGQIIGLIYATQAPDQDHINMVIKDSLNLLEWTQQNQSLFLDFVVQIITNCGKMFTNNVWELLFRYLHKLKTNNRISICSLLKQTCPIYLNFIKEDILQNQSPQFLKANQAIIQSNQKIFQSDITKYKKEETLKFFISQSFKDFIIKNIQKIPSNKEVYSVLRKCQIQKQDFPKLQEFLNSQLQNIKNIQAQYIYLIIHLMSTSYKQEGYKLFQKLIEINRIEVSQLQKDFKNSDTHSKSSSKDYDMIVKKTLNQVIIINSLSQQLLSINNQILEKILAHVEELITSSTSFNRNIPLRYHLWKNGLLKSLKQLPGLLKTERNSEMARFSIWYRIKTNQYMNDIVKRWSQIADRVVGILKEYRDKDKQRQRQKQRQKVLNQQQIQVHYFNQIQRQISDYKKLLPRIFCYLKDISWDSVLKQNKVRWLNSCCKILTSGLFRLKQGVSQAVNQDEQNLGALFEVVTSTI